MVSGGWWVQERNTNPRTNLELKTSNRISTHHSPLGAFYLSLTAWASWAGSGFGSGIENSKQAPPRSRTCVGDRAPGQSQVPRD